MKQFCLALAVMVSMPTMAAIQCGNYIMTGEGMTVINGETVTSQKVKFLGEDGIKIDMGLMPAKDGNNYGFQYIHRPGSESRFLNVQILQNSLDAPKIIGSFPCRKVPD